MATEKSNIEEREINGKKVRWDKDLGGPLTPVHPVEDEAQPEPDKVVRHGVELDPRAPDAYDSHRQLVAVQAAQKRAAQVAENVPPIVEEAPVHVETIPEPKSQ